MFNRLLGRNKKSKDVAKKRLRKVVAKDRADKSKVISSFAEIEQDALNIVQMDARRQSCLTAQMPVIGVASK